MSGLEVGTKKSAERTMCVCGRLLLGFLFVPLKERNNFLQNREHKK